MSALAEEPVTLSSSDGQTGLSVKGMSVTSTSGLTTIIGTIYDKATVKPVGAGVQVTIYCDHDSVTNTIKETVTKENGMYSGSTLNILPSKRCVSGDKAWIKVKYQDAEYQSGKVTVESAGVYDHASVNNWVGVPEYNTITLGLAVVAGGLGFVLLRKRN